MLSSAALTSVSRAFPLEGYRRLLVLTDGGRASLFRSRAPQAVVVTDAGALQAMEGPFDAALIEGVLEHEPWDRWVLQRVHRLLRMDAPIVLVVPPLVSLDSMVDLRFGTYAARRVLVRLLRRWRPGFDLGGQVRRRYRLGRLVHTMEALGYRAIEANPPALDGAWWPTPRWLARRATLVARKAASLRGVHGGDWPRADAHRRQHAAQYPGLQAAREAWLDAFPEFRAPAPRALDPRDWHEARVLVLSPHPDDELIGCGGTLCRLVAARAKVWVLQATDGSKLYTLRDLPEARRKTVRLEEAERVAAAIGAELECWRLEDGLLRCSPRTVAALARALARRRPTHVFTPFLGDMHADHRALSRTLAGALNGGAEEPRVLQYEVWSLVPANSYCDVTDQAQTLERLLLLYERAMRGDDFVHFCESRNLAHAFEFMGRAGYAEAFLSTTAAEYRRLAAKVAAP